MRELSMHILDVLENALEAGATQVRLSIEENLYADRLMISVRDNGQGMDAETARRALDPFFTTRKTRHVGLGLPLLAEAARRCDGSLTVDSSPGEGTTVTATFRHSHLDRAPLGNLLDSLLAFLLNERAADLVYHHQVIGCRSYGHEAEETQDRVFKLDTAAIRTELGEVPFSHPRVVEWLRRFIAEGEAALTSWEGAG
jgi:anti-sigma regulatory factor (Ser/Thr protein kinase)